MVKNPNNAKDKIRNEIRINSIFNPKGADFKEILKDSMKRLVQSGIINENMQESKKQMVIGNRIEDEDC